MFCLGFDQFKIVHFFLVRLCTIMLVIVELLGTSLSFYITYKN